MLSSLDKRHMNLVSGTQKQFNKHRPRGENQIEEPLELTEDGVPLLQTSV